MAELHPLWKVGSKLVKNFITPTKTKDPKSKKVIICIDIALKN
jgi:hypothetical protein